MKRSTLQRLALIGAPSLVSSIAFAQRNGASDAVANVAGCAVCSTVLLVPLIFFVLNIALLVWIARDAKARGMDNSVLWMLLVLFTSFVGLIIYLLSRPQGDLVPCPNCGNKKLMAAVRCPHCGFGA